ncbi:MAG: hypothetical protein IJ419_02990, partial [Agathobacter sp.]|nr:hypothetical protein [Agathobacter sp.]
TGPIRVEEARYNFEITLPKGVTVENKRVYEELEGCFLDVEGYDPLKKYPYAKEDMLWLSEGWVASLHGNLTYNKSLDLYVPDWDCSFSDSEEYFGVKLCTVQGDVYTYDIWGSHDELSYDSGYTYYWALIFDNPENRGENGEANWVLLNKDCFTKAEALTIGLSFVPDIYVKEETPAYEEYDETILYETTADLTHDGNDDLIQLVLKSKWSLYGVDSEWSYSLVKVFLGKADGTYYEADPIYVSDGYSRVHAANGTIVLTERNGKDYLMYSNMYEMQDMANYKYAVFYIGEDNKEVIVAADEVDFTCEKYSYLWDPYPTVLREEAVPALREQMLPWIKNGKILVALDAYTSVYMSTKDKVCPANTYYDLIWNRSERTDYGSKTSYKVAYRDVVKAFLDEYNDYVDGLRFSLVYFNDDKIPELVVKTGSLTVSMYTYHDGKIYPLIKQWGFGAGGNPGYFYVPKKNVFFNCNADFAGAINYLSFDKISEDYEFVSYYEKALRYQYIKDLNGDGMESPDEYDGNRYYFYGDKEITEEEFRSYFIGEADAEFPYTQLLPNDDYIELTADKPAAEILAELAE